MNEASIGQPTCMGCCINPNWINPYSPFTHDPFNYQTPNPFPNVPPHPSFPIIVDNTAGVALTPLEADVLAKTTEVYKLYCELDKRSASDNAEFVDAIHRLQQLIALRVARRVNPEVWAQPE